MGSVLISLALLLTMGGEQGFDETIGSKQMYDITGIMGISSKSDNEPIVIETFREEIKKLLKDSEETLEETDNNMEEEIANEEVDNEVSIITECDCNDEVDKNINEEVNIEQNDGTEEVSVKPVKKEFKGYNKDNLLEVSDITHEDMLVLLSDTGMYDIAYAIVDAEETYGVNAVALASLIALESGWGNSERAVFQNNVSGMGVYSDTSKGYEYSSREESVLDTARQLKENYLTENGMYYNGLALNDVNIKYCTSSHWATKIEAIADELTMKYGKLIK